MGKLDRRKFIKILVGSIAILGMGLSSQNTWAQSGSVKPRINKLETDVAVIGAGSGGLAAALRAGELGLKVCLFEKTDHTGGTLNGGMGPFGAGTHVQKKYGIKNCTTEDAYNILMDFTQGQIDYRLASEYIRNSAFTIKWLEDQGVLYSAMDGPRGGGFMHAISPHPDYKTDEKGMYIAMLLTDRIKANKNISLYLETPVKKLIKTGNSVTGLIAEDKNGNEVQVTAKAVIIMTGGFMGSPEMIEKYTDFTYGEDLFHTYDRPNISGDGIRMAWEVGAAKSEMMMAVYKGMPIFGGPAGTKNEWSIIANPNLMVNLRGERFVNEDLERYYMGNNIHRQPGGCVFLLMDSTIADIYRAQGPGIGPDNAVTMADVDEIVEEAGKLNYPYLFSADSLADLCEQTGIDLKGLEATIAEYNAFCEAGEDPVFYKDTRFLLPLKGPRYYAAQFCCDSFGGLGGIKINYKTEVLDEDLNPIPGLYSGGSDANTLYAGTYPEKLSGNFTGFAYTTGLMAAKNAAEYIR
jgi:fumarate reductase flavoprotein subunit